MRIGRRELIVGGVAALAGSLFAPAQAKSQSVPWLVYYNDKAPLDALMAYDLLILDSQYHPPLAPLSGRGKTLYGYLSVGEVERHRPHFAAVEAEGLVLEENRNWEGSFFVDGRDGRWTERVVEDLVPAILESGFDGVFLDTLDNPLYLQEREPDVYAGMVDAAANLVEAIRAHHPSIRIIVNRAYGILDRIAPFIDGVLGESVYASYDFETKTYSLVDASLYRQQVEILQSVARNHSHLRVLTLDYWDPEDADGIRRIYAEQRGNGFDPYVATIALNEIIPEP